MQRRSFYRKLFVSACAICLFYSNVSFAGSLEDGLNAYKQGNYAEAAKHYRRAAEQNNPEAQ